MDWPHCPICWTSYRLSPDGVGGWITRKACVCPEPPPIQITYSNSTTVAYRYSTNTTALLEEAAKDDSPMITISTPEDLEALRERLGVKNAEEA